MLVRVLEDVPVMESDENQNVLIPILSPLTTFPPPSPTQQTRSYTLPENLCLRRRTILTKKYPPFPPIKPPQTQQTQHTSRPFERVDPTPFLPHQHSHSHSHSHPK